jgi:hypothetical protein
MGWVGGLGGEEAEAAILDAKNYTPTFVINESTHCHNSKCNALLKRHAVVF